jgi:hypothetical protein
MSKVIVQKRLFCDVLFGCVWSLGDVSTSSNKARSVCPTCMNLISSSDNGPYWTDVIGLEG